MSRRAVPFTGEDADRLPEPCRACLFWERAAARPEALPVRSTARSSHGADREEAAARKRAWVSERVQEGHPPGRSIVVDGRLVGYALFAPAPAFASRGPWVASVSADALLLATVWIDPVHREAGLGRMLLQAAIKEALRLDLPAVEVYGDRRWQERSCMLPVTWLLHEGFEVHREHPRTPLLRLEARRTARWAESLEHAFEEVLGRLPRRVPVPSGDPIPRRAPAPGGVGPAGAGFSRPGRAGRRGR